MAIKVFEPRYMGEYCTLIEAVNWVALSMFPYGVPSELKDDKEFMEWYMKYIEDFYLNPDNYLMRFGIPQHPEVEYYFEMPNKDKEKFIKNILASEYVSDEEKNKLSQENISGFIAWQDSMDSILDFAKNEIISFITKGNIKSYGVKLKELIPNAMDWEKEENWVKCSVTEKNYVHKSIKQYFWTPSKLNLQESKIYSPKGCYGHIIIETDELLKKFPKNSNKTYNIKQIGESFFTEERKKSNSENRGRPQKDKDAISDELQRMYDNGELDKLYMYQTASNMQKWYYAEFKEKIGERTVNECVSNFYKEKKLGRYKTK